MVKKARDLLPPRPSRPRGSLGPRGRGLFQRLLGSFGSDQPEASPVREACAIAIASGKGGTGKSFLATSLAVLLHRMKRKVTLVDCDFGLACCHLLLGVNPRVSLQQVVLGTASIHDVRVKTECGPTLVPGASGVRRMANLTDQELLHFGRSLGEIAKDQDVIILDAGAGIAAQIVLTMLCANHVILVTQPEIAALTDAYAVIKCVRKLKPECTFSVVVNRVQATGHGGAAFERLQEVSQRHAGAEVTFLGEIPDDPMVTQRRLGQQPLVVTDPDGATAQSIAKIAARLEEEAGPLGPRVADANSGIEARFSEHRLFL